MADGQPTREEVLAAVARGDMPRPDACKLLGMTTEALRAALYRRRDGTNARDVTSRPSVTTAGKARGGKGGDNVVHLPRGRSPARARDLPTSAEPRSPNLPADVRGDLSTTASRMREYLARGAWVQGEGGVMEPKDPRGLKEVSVAFKTVVSIAPEVLTLDERLAEKSEDGLPANADEAVAELAELPTQLLEAALRARRAQGAQRQ